MYHVAPDGSDRNPGTAADPFRTIQRAVDAVAAGDTIRVHAGTYEEEVHIRRSGGPGRPIVLTSAGDGDVTVTSRQPPQSCSSRTPTRDRTLQVLDGSDHWVIRDLTIVNGVLISGPRNGRRVDREALNKSLPGRGDHADPEAARRTLESLGVDAADSIEVLHNVLRGRGIYTYLARFGVIQDNDISGVDCGTGPGILLSRFSDFWLVKDNHVHEMQPADTHFINEGIRHSNGSMYNVTEGNLVEDVLGKGRGITTDVNASWNVIRNNVVRRAAQGYSEQAGGWGNKWLNNLAEDNRKFGYNIYTRGQEEEPRLALDRLRPDAAVPAFLEVRCNRSTGSPVDLNIGAVRQSVFDQNYFKRIQISPKALRTWAGDGNRWEGSSASPPSSPSTDGYSACGSR
jgi:hypothetical protein